MAKLSKIAERHNENTKNIKAMLKKEFLELTHKTDNEEVFDKAVETLKNETSASWWIDRRDNTAMDLIKEVLHI